MIFAIYAPASKRKCTIIMKKRLLIILYMLALGVAPSALKAQTVFEGKISADRTVNNFGDLVTMSGPVSCDFTFTNLSDKPASLYSITSSCGCTVPVWSKEPIKKGAATTIHVTFKNEDAPGEFDKTLTCHFTNLQKPVILHIKGTVFPKKISLEERYPVKISEALAVKKQPLQLPNLEQDTSRETEFEIANLSNKPQSVVLEKVSPNLTVTLSENPIPAKSVVKMKVRAVASREKWGLTRYEAKIKGLGTLKFEGFTKENFSTWSDTDKAKSGKPYFDNSTLYFASLSAGEVKRGEFTFKNIGYNPLKIYKVDALDSFVKILEAPSEVIAGQKASIKVEVSTKGLQPGEYSSIVMLTTSSPSRPIVNIFVSFIVK